MKHAIWNNMLTIVFDPRRMGDGAMFSEEFGAFVDWVRSARTREDGDGILLPGDPERAMRKERAQAVPIDSGTLAQMDEAAAAIQKLRGAGPGPLSALAAA
jgi:uncharacterized oxidoreductase